MFVGKKIIFAKLHVTFANKKDTFAFICESFALIGENFAFIRESYAFISEGFELICEKYYPTNMSQMDFRTIATDLAVNVMVTYFCPNTQDKLICQLANKSGRHTT